MPISLTDPALIRLAGLTGSLAVMLASLVSALVFRGRQAERYSPLNHFISELGEVGVSRLSWLFNAGLIVGGAVLLPCCIGLGLLIPGVWSKLALVAGCVAAVSMALVGFFPMNNLKPHTLVAMTYFRAGLVMVILFTLAISLQPQAEVVIAKTVNWAGALAVLCYASFLVYSRVAFKKSQQTLDPTAITLRPRFWRLAALEWSIFFSTVLWFLVVGLVL